MAMTTDGHPPRNWSDADGPIDEPNYWWHYRRIPTSIEYGELWIDRIREEKPVDDDYVGVGGSGTPPEWQEPAVKPPAVGRIVHLPLDQPYPPLALPSFGPTCPKCGTFYGYKQTYLPQQDRLEVKCMVCGYKGMREPLEKG
jgi:hypothetical protein